MEYTINKLAVLSGVSTRTLRYYDEEGLLKPLRISSNGYRIYGEAEVDELQQILFYRELGFSLAKIREFIKSPNFDREKALKSHLSALEEQKYKIEKLMKNVSQTIDSLKGETVMSDKEKFEGFKQNLIDENERKYGKEIREKYGDAEIDATNAKIKGMSEEEYSEAQRLSSEIADLLKSAIQTGDPAGVDAQKACDCHKRWLMIYYPNYSAQYHKALGEMYVGDERFKQYYEKIAPGCAEFLRDAINIYCAE